MDARRPKRIDRHRRRESRIDAAREAEHDPGKAVVLDIIAQAHHAGRIVRFVALLDALDSALDAAPAGIAALPDRARDLGPKGRQLRRQGPVAVQRERRALEHQFVLAADLVEVNERQPAFHDAGHRDAFANGELVAFVRGGVGDQQDFAAGLEDAFDRVGAPDVLADRHADAHPAKDDRPRRRPRRKHALLVKNAIIGQIDLEAHRFDAPAVEERHCVEELAVLDPGQAHQRGGPAVGRQAREIL